MTMRFRPCIDLHDGKVKQIVGATLGQGPASLQTNFSTEQSPAFYASMYRRDKLTGGHVIMLGPGNEDAAMTALSAWPGGLQLGGGVTEDNASDWLARGASHLIVTSWIFHEGHVDMARLKRLARLVGKERLVLDLSCRYRDGAFYVVSDRWQRFTNVCISEGTLSDLSAYCAEFLVHAVDVEGACAGPDPRLIKLLAEKSPIPTTYAGGIASMDDWEFVRKAGGGRIDATVGSALDIFGGAGLRYQDLVALQNGRDIF